ncbi:MAG: hypothetical protein Q8M80_12930 [Hydrogenophaga sp.]|nr:hypothetical protein [Hydrogenophaga sp.]
MNFKGILTAPTRTFNIVKTALAFLKSNPYSAFLIGATVFVISAILQYGITKALEKLVPHLDDSNTIIVNQTRRFDQVDQILRSLEANMSATDSKRLDELRSVLSAASSDSKVISAQVAQLRSDNANFRLILDKEKGLDGAVDMLVLNGDGFKIDNITTLGLIKANYNRTAELSLSTLNKNESVSSQSVSPGQSLAFTNAKQQSCQVTFLGFLKVENNNLGAGKFAYQCGSGTQQKTS